MVFTYDPKERKRFFSTLIEAPIINTGYVNIATYA